MYIDSRPDISCLLTPYIPGAEGATAPPIMFLEGHCPLKNNQSCDAVLYLIIVNGGIKLLILCNSNIATSFITLCYLEEISPFCVIAMIITLAGSVMVKSP